MRWTPFRCDAAHASSCVAPASTRHTTNYPPRLRAGRVHFPGCSRGCSVRCVFIITSLILSLCFLSVIFPPVFPSRSRQSRSRSRHCGAECGPAAPARRGAVRQRLGFVVSLSFYCGAVVHCVGCFVWLAVVSGAARGARDALRSGDVRS